jgi:small subunit ribosomal protein S20
MEPSRLASGSFGLASGCWTLAHLASPNGGTLVANIQSAIKRHRQSLKRRARNRHYKSLMKGQIKSLRLAFEDKDAAREETLVMLRATTSIIAHVAQKGVIKAANASRKISRLQHHFNAKFEV